MVIIFEDNPNSSISKLLSKYVTSRDTIVFSEGNIFLKEEIKKYPKDTDILVYCDVSPDNNETVEIYHELIVLQDEYCNMTVIPIPCIEYSVIHMNYALSGSLGKTKYALALEGIINHANIEYPIVNISSVERLCKQYLYDGQNCFKNFTIDEEVNGLFYKVDCNCGFKYCKTVHESVTLIHKWYLLFKYTGAIPLIEKMVEHMNSNQISFAELKDGARIDTIDRFYEYLNSICNTTYKIYASVKQLQFVKEVQPYE